MAATFINSTGTTIGTAASTWSIECHSSRHGGAMHAVGIGLASTTVSVTDVVDNLGSTYSLAIAAGASKPQGAELWYRLNISSGSTRVFVNLSGTSSGALAIGQFNGVSTANALLQTGSSAITANSTSHGSAQITPSEDNALVISLARWNASTIGTVTVLGGMNTWLSTATTVRTLGLYSIQTNASTVTGSFTTSSNCQHASVIAAFSDTRAIVVKMRRRSLSMLGCGA